MNTYDCCGATLQQKKGSPQPESMFTLKTLNMTHPFVHGKRLKVISGMTNQCTVENKNRQQYTLDTTTLNSNL